MFHQIHCIRDQWVFGEEFKKLRGGLTVEEIRSPRLCRLYVKWEPGFSPEEHKELVREARTRRVIVYTGLGGAVIGGTIGTVAALLAG